MDIFYQMVILFCRCHMILRILLMVNIDFTFTETLITSALVTTFQVIMVTRIDI